LEEAVATAGVELPLYVDAGSYDETPMETRTQDVVYEVAAPPPPQAQSAVGAAIVVAQLPQVSKTTIGSDSGPTTLFQTVTNVAMLVKSRPTPEGEPGKYFLFLGQPVGWVTTPREGHCAGAQGCSARDFGCVACDQFVSLGPSSCLLRQALGKPQSREVPCRGSGRCVVIAYHAMRCPFSCRSTNQDNAPFWRPGRAHDPAELIPAIVLEYAALSSMHEVGRRQQARPSTRGVVSRCEGLPTVLHQVVPLSRRVRSEATHELAVVVQWRLAKSESHRALHRSPNTTRGSCDLQSFDDSSAPCTCIKKPIDIPSSSVDWSGSRNR
jgi:hypothetical protein